MAATCLAAALGSILMGWLANYPFALAPGMPAFFTIAMMPLACSNSEGIVMGIIAFTFLRLVCWRTTEISATLWILTVLFLLRYLLV